MSATVHRIVAREDPKIVSGARPATLDLAPTGELVDPALVLRGPHLSLYCLDHREQRALFVETPPGARVRAQPFMYLAQHAAAQRVVSMSFSDLHTLADRARPSDAQLTFILTMGRSGSTLLSTAYRAVEGVVSLSEPDVLGGLGRRWLEGLEGERSAVRLVESAVSLLCRPSLAEPAPGAWVLKFRAEELMLVPLLRQAFPRARYVYAYRAAPGWIRSIMRLQHRRRTPPPPEKSDPPGPLEHRLAPRLASYLADPTTDHSTLALRTLAWCTHLETYTQYVAEGVPFVATRYRHLCDAPRQIFAQLFAHSKLAPPDASALRASCQQDAQAGTHLARTHQLDLELSPQHLDSIRRVLAWHPLIDDPQYTVPNTLRPMS